MTRKGERPRGPEGALLIGSCSGRRRCRSRNLRRGSSSGQARADVPHNCCRCRHCRVVRTIFPAPPAPTHREPAHRQAGGRAAPGRDCSCRSKAGRSPDHKRILERRWLRTGAPAGSDLHAGAVLRQPKSLGIGRRRSRAKQRKDRRGSRSTKPVELHEGVFCQPGAHGQAQILTSPGGCAPKKSPGLSSRARLLNPQSISGRTS